MKLEKQINLPRKIETFSTKNDEDIQFYVEIHETPYSYESWIYRNDCGIKEMMFGITRENLTKQIFIELVNNQLEEYAMHYEEEYL